MKVRNARNWAPRGTQRWCLAVVALVIASAVRFALHPLLGPMMPATTFCICASLVEYFLGLGPALTVMILGLGIADYMFVPPYRNVTFIDAHDVVLSISYPLVTLIVITLIERLRRAQFRAQLITAVAQSRYEMLLRNDNERALARRSIDETHRLLRHLAQHHDGFILIKGLERKATQLGGSNRAVADALPQATEVAPGPLFNVVHPDDLPRLTHSLSPGPHRVRLQSRQHKREYRMTNCSCERFTTHAGDFLVLRMEN